MTKCKRCFEDFANPRKLSCGHSICEFCAQQQYSFYILNHEKEVFQISNWQKTDPLEKLNRTPSLTSTVPIACLHCSKTTPVNTEIGVSSLPINFDLREALSEIEQEGKVKCSNIKCSLAATKGCLECATIYCDFHTDLHNRAVEDHVSQVMSLTIYQALISTQEDTCLLHNQPYQYFCETDHKKICSECAADPLHKSHKRITLMQHQKEQHAQVEMRILAMKNQKDYLKKIDTMMMKSMDRLATSYGESVSSVNAEFDAFIKVVNERRSELLKQMKETFDRRKQMMQLTHSAHQYVLRAIENSVGHLNSIKEEKKIEEGSILSTLQLISDTQMIMSQPTITKAEIKCYTDLTAAKRAIADVGRVDEVIHQGNKTTTEKAVLFKFDSSVQLPYTVIQPSSLAKAGGSWDFVTVRVLPSISTKLEDINVRFKIKRESSFTSFGIIDAEKYNISQASKAQLGDLESGEAFSSHSSIHYIRFHNTKSETPFSGMNFGTGDTVLLSFNAHAKVLKLTVENKHKSVQMPLKNVPSSVYVCCSVADPGAEIAIV